MKILNREIINLLAKKLELDPKTIKKNIYLLQKDYPNLTKNAVAQIYARKNSLSIFRKLDKEDKASLPSVEMLPEKIILKTKNKNNKSHMRIILEYETSDYFINGHIKELNKAYTHDCFTAVFILFRKIIENLIIDILRKKYPENGSKENKELYFDITQNRFKDFSVILRNFYDKRNEFGSKNKAIERLYNLIKPLKDDVNDKTHSWYHLVEKEQEVKNLNSRQIIEIIKELEKTVGIR